MGLRPLKEKRQWLWLLLLVAACSIHAPASGLGQTVVWHPWSDAVSAQAQREHKFVLLDLEAVWCHWCHVMDRETYRDPAVRSLMATRYIAIKVDQGSRPDLSNRYEDYGWPATVIFAAAGSDIVKRQGYLPPKQIGIDFAGGAR